MFGTQQPLPATRPAKRMFLERGSSTGAVITGDDIARHGRRHFAERTGKERGESTRHKEQPAKFQKGFFKRPAAQIQPYTQRLETEGKHAEKAQKKRDERKVTREKMDRYNGNPITHEPSPHGHPFGRVETQRGRKFYNQDHQSEVLQRETYLRSHTGSTRYHTPIGEEARQKKLQVRQTRLQSMNRTSSAIGYGRADLPSMGVLDNFSGPPPPLPRPSKHQPIKRR